jgi:hypothetical protein
LEFVPTRANPSPPTPGVGSIGVFHPENLTPAPAQIRAIAVTSEIGPGKSKYAPEAGR